MHDYHLEVFRSEFSQWVWIRDNEMYLQKGRELFDRLYRDMMKIELWLMLIDEHEWILQWNVNWSGNAWLAQNRLNGVRALYRTRQKQTERERERFFLSLFLFLSQRKSNDSISCYFFFFSFSPLSLGRYNADQHRYLFFVAVFVLFLPFTRLLLTMMNNVDFSFAYWQMIGKKE